MWSLSNVSEPRIFLWNAETAGPVHDQLQPLDFNAEAHAKWSSHGGQHTTWEKPDMESSFKTRCRAKGWFLNHLGNHFESFWPCIVIFLLIESLSRQKKNQKAYLPKKFLVPHESMWLFTAHQSSAGALGDINQHQSKSSHLCHQECNLTSMFFLQGTCKSTEHQSQGHHLYTASLW